MMSRRQLRSGGLGLVFLLGLASALAAAPQEAPFAGATQVLAVEVPVQVVRDGEPVRGLEAADFEVWEGRRKLPVSGFEVLDLAAPSAAPERAAGAPAAARRHFLFLFDLAFSEPKSVVRARRAAASLLPELHPTDLVAVATYGASRGPQLVLGFTSDRRQIESALATLGLPDLMVRPADPLRLVIQEVLSAENAAGGGGAQAGSRDPLAEASDVAVLQRLQSATGPDRAERAAQQGRVEVFTRSLSGLARQMAVVEGRKYLVFLSEGFDGALLRGTEDPLRQEEMREDSLRETWRVDSEERFGSSETANAVERMLEEFRRADCTIQAVDIGGLRAAGEPSAPRLGGRDSLLMMARGTGGELFERFNDLAAAMSRMLKRTSVTYVLAVHPERQAAAAGEYHPLRVELKRPLSGARVTHRPGYYPPEPYSEQDPLEKLLQAANLLMSGEESDAVALAVLAPPFRSAGEKAYVPVLIEAAGSTLLAGPQPAALPVEVYIYALDGLGAVHDFVTQTVTLDLAKAEPLLRQSGLKFFGHLDLLPGQYSLRVMVRNGGTGATGLRVLPLSVPAPGAPALLPALAPEPPNRWLVVREERAEGQAAPYPFLLGDKPFLPASLPVLAGGREVQLALAGYNLGADWQAEARLLTPEGREIPGATFAVVERRSGGGGAPDRAVARFRPPDLAPGDYVLRISIPGLAGAPESSLRFRVAAGERR